MPSCYHAFMLLSRGLGTIFHAVSVQTSGIVLTYENDYSPYPNTVPLEIAATLFLQKCTRGSLYRGNLTPRSCLLYSMVSEGGGVTEPMGTQVQTVQRKKAFLDAFRVSGNMWASCHVTGIGRTNVYTWRDKDRRFAAALIEAENEAAEHLEAEALRRAVDGIEEPVYQGGHMVGVVRRYSDTLLIFLLKGAKPEKYKDRWELAGKDGMPLLSMTALLQMAQVQDAGQKE